MHILTKKNGERRKKRFAAIGMATFVTLAGAGAAFAYWTTTGTGSGGGGSTSAPSAVTVVQTSTGTITAPGGSVALSGVFNNPNSGPSYVTSVTAVVNPTFTSSVVNASLPACTPLDFTITGTSNTPGDVPAGSAKGTWSGLTLTLTDSATNQDNCENLTSVPIVYTSN
jgi:hypothetical protein